MPPNRHDIIRGVPANPDWLRLVLETDPRPCGDCDKRHDRWQYDDGTGAENPRWPVSWSDPADGHTFRPPSWEAFARDLVAGRTDLTLNTIGGGTDG